MKSVKQIDHVLVAYCFVADYPQNSVTQNNIYDFIVFASQKFMSSLVVWVWFRVSHETAVKMLPGVSHQKPCLGLEDPLPSRQCGLCQEASGP